jgi:hypothetical protein
MIVDLEWLAASARCVCREADCLHSRRKLVDAINAKLLEAREEQREADRAALFDEGFRKDFANEEGWSAHFDSAAHIVESAPLTATPLADENAKLRARVAEFERREKSWAVDASILGVKIGKLEYRVKELEACTRCSFATPAMRNEDEVLCGECVDKENAKLREAVKKLRSALTDFHEEHGFDATALLLRKTAWVTND